MIRTVAMEFDLVCDRKGQVIFLSFIFQPLEIDSLYNETLELSGVESPSQHSILVLKRKG